MEQRIEKILKEVLSDFDNYEGRDIIKDGVVDSVQFLEIISAIEDEFHIEIAAEEMISDNFKSVDTMKELILRS